jgi:hypothetical protein
MLAALTAPAAAPLIVIAIAVIAVTAVVAVLIILRRSMRLSALTIGISAAVAVAIVAGAALVGGTLAGPSPATAVETPPKGLGDAYEPALVGVQLPTLDLP